MSLQGFTCNSRRRLHPWIWCPRIWKGGCIGSRICCIICSSSSRSTRRLTCGSCAVCIPRLVTREEGGKWVARSTVLLCILKRLLQGKIKLLLTRCSAGKDAAYSFFSFFAIQRRFPRGNLICQQSIRPNSKVAAPHCLCHCLLTKACHSHLRSK